MECSLYHPIDTNLKTGLAVFASRSFKKQPLRNATARLVSILNLVIGEFVNRKDGPWDFSRRLGHSPSSPTARSRTYCFGQHNHFSRLQSPKAVRIAASIRSVSVIIRKRKCSQTIEVNKSSAHIQRINRQRDA